jgi:hypothetical protein
MEQFYLRLYANYGKLMLQMITGNEWLEEQNKIRSDAFEAGNNDHFNEECRKFQKEAESVQIRVVNMWKGDN